MTRRDAREIALHILFRNSFLNEAVDDLIGEAFNADRFEALGKELPVYSELPDEKQAEYIVSSVRGVYNNFDELNSYIEKYSVGWKVTRISRIAASIMRLSMYEIKYGDVPAGASVNEAVELAKKYDTADSASFVNGILGSFVRNEIQNA